MTETEELRDRLETLRKKMSDTALLLTAASVRLQSQEMLDPQNYIEAVNALNELSDVQTTFTNALCEHIPEEPRPTNIEQSLKMIDKIEESLSKADSFEILHRLKLIRSKTGVDNDLATVLRTAEEICRKDITAEQLRTELKPYSDFLSAVEDKDSCMELSLALEETNRFSDKLLFHLVTGYFSVCDEEQEPIQPVSELKAENKIETEQTDQREKAKDPIEVPIDEASTGTPDEEAAADTELSSMELEYAKLPQIDFTESDLSEADELSAAGLNTNIISGIEYSVECGDLSIPKNPKQVKKDLERNNSGNLIVALKATGYSAVTAKMLKYSNDNADFYIESLFKSGYFNKLNIPDKDPIYYLSQKGGICFKDVSGLSPKNYKDALRENTKFVFDEDHFGSCPAAENNVVAIMGYVKCCELVQKAYSDSSADSVGVSRLGSLIQYCIISKLGRGNIGCLVISSVLPDKIMFTHFVHSLRSFFAGKKIMSVFIASDRIENCEILSEFIHNHYGKSIVGKTIYYDILADKLFCSENTDMELSEDEVCQQLTQKRDTSALNSGNSEKPAPETAEDAKTMTIGNSAAGGTAPDKNPMPEKSKSAEKTKTAVNDTDVNNGKTSSESPITDPNVLLDDEKSNEESSVSKDEIINTVSEMLNAGKSYCASAYLLAIKEHNAYAAQLYTELAYAVNDPAADCKYTSMDVMSAFEGADSDSLLSQQLYLSAAVRMLFYSYSHNDFYYKQLVDMIKNTANEISPELGRLIYQLMVFRQTSGTGVDAYADYRLVGELALKKELDNVKHSASELYERYVLNSNSENIHHPRFLSTKKAIFRQSNDLCVCLKSASEDDTSMLEDAVKFLNDNGFIQENAEVCPENIQRIAIEAYMDKFWDKAGNAQNIRQKSDELKSSGRTNLFHGILKSLETITSWVNVHSELSESASADDYLKEKGVIRSLIESAMAKCRELVKNASAGICCIHDTLSELYSRIKGEYKIFRHNYYYAPFLMYGKIMLNNDFLPNIQRYRAAVKGFSPVQRIKEQAKLPNRSFEDRISEIFNQSEAPVEKNSCDDYGCARLIKEYLDDVREDFVWNSTYDIEQNSSEAKRQLEDKRKQFVESLEFSQSSGKITHSYKEQLLRLGGYEYQTAINTENYGFYNRFVSCCTNCIDEEARVQEDMLRDALNTIDSSEKNETDREKIDKLIADGRRQLEMQNYTVVEDIINRINRSDLDDFEFANSSDDTFDKFLISYEDNYMWTKSPGTPPSHLYSNPTNKDQKAANNIIDNFPGTGRINEQRMTTLLTALGFKCERVWEITPIIAKSRCFDVSVQKPHSNTKQNYTHPIFPFGSLAVEDGFRTVCLYGHFDADNLIKDFNELGDTKNCIIFLDYALTLPEKRTLARKSKQERFAKVFIVVDRVAARFLAQNYSESRINSRLMEITLPFSSYQPYCSNPSQPLPVEMFMGRKNQLTMIKEPNGANLVCGGRQLGKSALLIMAKNEIDRNENGDRAICVSIKDANYKKAAYTVSNELVIDGILPEGSLTDDWDVLSSEIIKRLKSSEERIPYLLIMMDEADAFINSCKEVSYAPIAELEKIQQIGIGRFKFVVAGLHNLVRLEREIAESDNSVLARIKTLIVEPFNTMEARELLEVPLHYLGMRFPEDKAYLISNILSSTNYFPGLIHTYCEKLIAAMQKDDYAGYNSQSDPPYEITEAHIKKVLADPGFNSEIRNKLIITLKVDNDNLYYIIALLMAYCYNDTPSADGFSAEQIFAAGTEFEIKAVSELSVEKISALMDELCKLNVLTLNPTNNYSFARYNFIQLLGKPEEIENEILKYSVEVQNA